MKSPTGILRVRETNKAVSNECKGLHATTHQGQQRGVLLVPCPRIAIRRAWFRHVAVANGGCRATPPDTGARGTMGVSGSFHVMDIDKSHASFWQRGH